MTNVKNKIMFYLWDSVFRQNKRPLTNFLEDIFEQKDFLLITYEDFFDCADNFISKVYEEFGGNEIESKIDQELSLAMNPDIDFSSDNPTNLLVKEPSRDFSVEQKYIDEQLDDIPF